MFARDLCQDSRDTDVQKDRGVSKGRAEKDVM